MSLCEKCKHYKSEPRWNNTSYQGYEHVTRSSIQGGPGDCNKGLKGEALRISKQFPIPEDGECSGFEPNV